MLEVEGTGGVTELGRDHPGPGEVEMGAAVSLVVTSLECEAAVCGAGFAAKFNTYQHIAI